MSFSRFVNKNNWDLFAIYPSGTQGIGTKGRRVTRFLLGVFTSAYNRDDFWLVGLLVRLVSNSICVVPVRTYLHYFFLRLLHARWDKGFTQRFGRYLTLLFRTLNFGLGLVPVLRDLVTTLNDNVTRRVQVTRGGLFTGVICGVVGVGTTFFTFRFKVRNGLGRGVTRFFFGTFYVNLVCNLGGLVNFLSRVLFC